MNRKYALENHYIANITLHHNYEPCQQQRSKYACVCVIYCCEREKDESAIFDIFHGIAIISATAIKTIKFN